MRLDGEYPQADRITPAGWHVGLTLHLALENSLGWFNGMVALNVCRIDRIATDPCRIAPSADDARSRKTLVPHRRHRTASRPGGRRRAASGIGRHRVQPTSSTAYPVAAR